MGAWLISSSIECVCVCVYVGVCVCSKESTLENGRVANFVVHRVCVCVCVRACVCVAKRVLLRMGAWLISSSCTAKEWSLASMLRRSLTQNSQKSVP